MQYICSFSDVANDMVATYKPLIFQQLQLMTACAPTILALDFDGVVCDGLLEYFQTSWRTYCQIWQPPNQIPPDDLAPKFYRLRPVVETGWEMPILLRALILGISEETILQDWLTVAQELITSEKLNAADIGKKLDNIRDEWIKTDLDNWLGLHRFYPGVIERIRRMLAPTPNQLLDTPTLLYIVTTKEGRFVKQLLQQQGIQLSAAQIIGKESQRPKHQTLRQLIETTGNSTKLWFVEDRLKTLQLVEQQSHLKDVRLYLADWGYNTKAHRDSVRNHSRIKLLSLSLFAQDFSDWPH